MAAPVIIPFEGGALRVTKSVNNNAVLACDEAGNEVVIFGRGVGFRKPPYDLPSQLNDGFRVFRGVDSSVLAALRSIPDALVDVSMEIADMASNELGTRLNPNLAFTLADHFQFASERIATGMSLANPLVDQVAFIYPRETQVGHAALRILRERIGLSLPQEEASSVALHLVNAETMESAAQGMSFVMSSAQLISDAVDAVESCLDVSVDRMSYAYVRFVTHLRYLVARVERDELGDAMLDERPIIEVVRGGYPRDWACAQTVSVLLTKKYGREVSEGELAYLALHINRLRKSSSF